MIKLLQKQNGAVFYASQCTVIVKRQPRGSVDGWVYKAALQSSWMIIIRAFDIDWTALIKVGL